MATNLLSNAMKFTNHGCVKLIIDAEHVETDRMTLRFTVRDTGIGLSQEDQDKLFTKFFRSSDPRVQRERGTGLGLAVTHALVTRIGGKITVDSEPDHGTTFRLTLPSARSG